MQIQQQPEIFDKLITKKQLAKKMGMSESFVNKWMSRGLPFYKLGRFVRFNWNEVVLWLERSHFNEP